MKIISKFKDYYDGVMAHGRDNFPIYLREHTQIKVERQHMSLKDYKELCIKIEPLMAIVRQMPSGLNEMQRCVVGFCGRVYPFYKIGGRACYSFQDVLSYFKEQVKAEKEADRESIEKGWGKRRYLQRSAKDIVECLEDSERNIKNDTVFSQRNWKNFQDKISAISMKDEIFREFKSPCLMLEADAERHHSIYFEVNPTLKDISFARVVEPFLAFQEIDMFLGNNLADQVDPPSPMTDALKVHSHGFDKWSFRTHKEDSKKSKKAKKK